LALLVGVAAFKDIAEPVLDRIEARSRAVDFHDGAQIFAQGDAADAVYAIIGGPGRVRIGAVGRDSKGLMVEILGTGDIFGEIGVMDGSLRTADAFADGNVRLLRIGAPVFIETLTTHAALAAICAACSRSGCAGRRPTAGCHVREPRGTACAAGAVSCQARRTTLRTRPAVGGTVPAG